MCVFYLPDGVGRGNVEHLLAGLVERVGERLEDGDEEEEHLLIGVRCVLFVSWHGWVYMCDGCGVCCSCHGRIYICDSIVHGPVSLYTRICARMSLLACLLAYPEVRVEEGGDGGQDEEAGEDAERGGEAQRTDHVTVVAGQGFGWWGVWI